MNIKRNGCCTLCDEPVFEIAPSTGAVGQPLDNAVRATLILTDGSTVSLTFCDQCETETKLTEIWSKCVETMAFQCNHLAEIKGRKVSDQEIEVAQQEVIRLMGMVPLGVVGAIAWSEVNDILNTRLASG
ncbi:hypothetical protein LCGC14_1405090 [marine sediment metagenome]|uniref:Uncharacterized protein n=1 Tax=marine sediment metagenome TaxID=412755 RepID=A0A0F9MXH3_9ZZZZ